MSEWQGHLLSCSGQLKINCKTVKYLYTSLVKIINILHGQNEKISLKIRLMIFEKITQALSYSYATNVHHWQRIVSKFKQHKKISLIARKVNIRYRLRLRSGHFSRLWVPSKKLWSNFESRIRGPWLIFSHMTGCWRCLASFNFSFQLKHTSRPRLSLLLVKD